MRWRAARGSGSRRAAAEIEGETTVLEADSDDLDRVAELAGEVEAALGPGRDHGANTGGPPLGGALDNSIEEWEAAYRSLVLAPRALIEAALPGMRERGWGRIVNVSSSSVREPIPHLALSNTHRMATVGFLKTLAGEVAADGITVNTVATGRFATDRLASNWGSWEEMERRAHEGVPAGRLGFPGGVRRPGRLSVLGARGLSDGHRDSARRWAASLH